ncbi:MAG: tRNA uridine-5-carboxymethylaminomethyl(34) synthesis enzyme MnmG [Synergistota bacterium]|nr:tRNA uridine-5-carboxymethylaminomethyl(34) synthesis enzyme MnmG [Synergistota bacterium]
MKQLMTRETGNENFFDVIVIGAGHAGCEAALAAARMGARTLLLNLYLDNMALMACNPSIGGPAKGHLTREIDALGGEQARASDSSTLHIRWLNTSKGAGVRTLRAQCDLVLFHQWYKEVCEKQPNLLLMQEEATDLWIEKGRVRGVKTRTESVYRAGAVILTTGVYLGGKVHIGLVNFTSGPLGQMPATELGASLRKAGFDVERLKTGTTPRIHAESVDFSGLEPQESENEPLAFSHWGDKKKYSGFACHITRTSTETHEIIRSYLDRSPLFTGVIEGRGPRYCPSIEDRVMRFPHKDSHLVFLEPVATRSREIYMQNFTTSLPMEAQIQMVRSLPGCEKAEIMRPGYAIEYDYMPPVQLKPWMETRNVRGLYCAGQINGTSGYEEAAAQGILAGINAVLGFRGEDPLVFDRSRGYMAVLVDDLVTRGTTEPYRMLTSRCEYRLLLRHDNADIRMAPTGRKLGLIDDCRWKELQSRWKALESELERLDKTRIRPCERLKEMLAELGEPEITQTLSAADLLKRPGLTWEMTAELAPPPEKPNREVIERAAVAVKYEGYIRRQEKQVEQMKKMEKVRIPEDLDYNAIDGLLSESRQKLARLRPETLGRAGRISGVTPADLMLLRVVLEQKRRGENRCVEKNQRETPVE